MYFLTCVLYCAYIIYYIILSNIPETLLLMLVSFYISKGSKTCLPAVQVFFFFTITSCQYSSEVFMKVFLKCPQKGQQPGDHLKPPPQGKLCLLQLVSSLHIPTHFAYFQKWCCPVQRAKKQNIFYISMYILYTITMFSLLYENACTGCFYYQQCGCSVGSVSSVILPAHYSLSHYEGQDRGQDDVVSTVRGIYTDPSVSVAVIPMVSTMFASIENIFNQIKLKL